MHRNLNNFYNFNNNSSSNNNNPNISKFHDVYWNNHKKKWVHVMALWPNVLDEQNYKTVNVMLIDGTILKNILVNKIKRINNQEPTNRRERERERERRKRLSGMRRRGFSLIYHILKNYRFLQICLTHIPIVN